MAAWYNSFNRKRKLATENVNEFITENVNEFITENVNEFIKVINVFWQNFENKREREVYQRMLINSLTFYGKRVVYSVKEQEIISPIS